MRFRRSIFGVFVVSVVVQIAVRAQVAPPVARPAIPTYIRKFRSDKDVNRPTRLNEFAFRVAGYPAAEDRVVDHRGQWEGTRSSTPTKSLWIHIIWCARRVHRHQGRR